VKKEVVVVVSMVEEGKKAPIFELPDQDGKVVSLTDLAGRWVVLYFYPKDDTPGCTTEACEFTQGIEQFEKLDAVVLGVSPDSPESHRRFIEQRELRVRLLSDPEHKVMETYGAWGVKNMYGKETVGVIRSTALIDPEGEVVKHWRKVKAAGHAEQVRLALEKARG
jgi:peroxiredoxin Q/BCP